MAAAAGGRFAEAGMLIDFPICNRFGSDVGLARSKALSETPCLPAMLENVSPRRIAYWRPLTISGAAAGVAAGTDAGEEVGTYGTTDSSGSGDPGRTIGPGGGEVVVVLVVVVVSAGGRPDTTELASTRVGAGSIDDSLFPDPGGKA